MTSWLFMDSDAILKCGILPLQIYFPECPPPERTTTYETLTSFKSNRISSSNAESFQCVNYNDYQNHVFSTKNYRINGV